MSDVLDRLGVRRFDRFAIFGPRPAASRPELERRQLFRAFSLDPFAPERPLSLVVGVAPFTPPWEPAIGPGAVGYAVRPAFDGPTLSDVLDASVAQGATPPLALAAQLTRLIIASEIAVCSSDDVIITFDGELIHDPARPPYHANGTLVSPTVLVLTAALGIADSAHTRSLLIDRSINGPRDEADRLIAAVMHMLNGAPAQSARRLLVPVPEGDIAGLVRGLFPDRYEQRAREHEELACLAPHDVEGLAAAELIAPRLLPMPGADTTRVECGDERTIAFDGDSVKVVFRRSPPTSAAERTGLASRYTMSESPDGIWLVRAAVLGARVDELLALGPTLTSAMRAELAFRVATQIDEELLGIGMRSQENTVIDEDGHIACDGLDPFAIGPVRDPQSLGRARTAWAALIAAIAIGRDVGVNELPAIASGAARPFTSDTTIDDDLSAIIVMVNSTFSPGLSATKIRAIAARHIPAPQSRTPLLDLVRARFGARRHLFRVA